MKTLDEVIKALDDANDGRVECNGDTECGYYAIGIDALHYLKEYQEMKEHLACLDSHTLHGDETERRYDNGNLERY